MRCSSLCLTALLACGAGSLRAQTAAAKTPFADEALAYTINWASGLSLGEGRLQAKRTGSRWGFALSLDAAVPGFAVSDSYRAIAEGDFCSVEFEKQFTHGKKRADEKTTFDSEKRTATRKTIVPAGGGKTEMTVPACARDALTYLFYLRHELSQGKLPGPQTVYFGAPYNIRLEYGGQESVKLDGRTWEADRLRASLKGPASEAHFEIVIGRDATRTPLIVRVPFSLGTFSMELVP